MALFYLRFLCGLTYNCAVPNPMVITFGVLILAILVLLSDRVRPDLVALTVAILLGVTGILTLDEVFSGFSRSAVIIIVAVFILAEGLQRTGVTDQAGKMMVRRVGKKEGSLAITGMVSGAILSLVMNNIAAASVLLPVISGAAKKSRAHPSRLLIPLAFGTILGGMATLFTTTNIIISGLLRENNLTAFGVLDFLPVGIPMVVLGVSYMILVGPRLLPRKSPHYAGQVNDQDSLLDIYRLDERIIRARLTKGSLLSSMTVAQSNLRKVYNLNLIAIERNDHAILSFSPDTVLQPGDVLVMQGRQDEIASQNFEGVFEFLPAQGWRSGYSDQEDFTVVETLLTPRSSLIGQTLRATHFREKYKMNVLGIFRQGRPIRTGLSDLQLEFGDALLLQGPKDQVYILRSEPELIVMASEAEEIPRIRRKAPLALVILLVALVIASSGLLPVAEVMMAGALAMVLLRAITMDQAYQAVEWKSVFLVAGMLPLGIAMNKTGAAGLLANGMVQLLGGQGPLVLLAGIVILGVLLTQVVHGAVVATILGPIVIQIAHQVGVDPHTFAMGLAMATSMAFITPLGHPVNVLVMSPGGYHFKDYVRVGLPMTILLVGVLLAILPFLWPFK